MNSGADCGRSRPTLSAFLNREYAIRNTEPANGTESEESGLWNGMLNRKNFESQRSMRIQIRVSDSIPSTRSYSKINSAFRIPLQYSLFNSKSLRSARGLPSCADRRRLVTNFLPITHGMSSAGMRHYRRAREGSSDPTDHLPHRLPSARQVHRRQARRASPWCGFPRYRSGQ